MNVGWLMDNGLLLIEIFSYGLTFVAIKGRHSFIIQSIAYAYC